MNTETANAELYEKMLEEQENFRGWLLGQPPEEILNHTYEYTIREDILMEMEYLELSFSQMQMLLSSPTPLADIFKEYNRQETSHMEEIRDCCISRADEVQKQAKECPLYLHDAAYADAHDEMESYIASLRINTACKNMIEDAIAAAYQDNSLKYVQEASKAVIDTFGFDRPMYVFARDGFAPFREEYKKACVNIGRRVTFDLPGGGEGSGEAVDIDEDGRLVVRTDSGEEHVFTGEVSVHGIYGAV